MGLFQGLLHLKKVQDRTFPPEEHYLRFIGVFGHDGTPYHGASDEFSNDSDIKLVICMFQENSRRLSQAHYLQSDIAFRRIASYEEFELGGWDEANNTSELGLTISSLA